MKRLPSADVPDLMSPQTNQNLPVQVISNKNIRLKLKWHDPQALIVKFKVFPGSWNEMQILKVSSKFTWKRKSRWIFKKLIVSVTERFFNDSAIVIVRSINIVKQNELLGKRMKRHMSVLCSLFCVSFLSFCQYIKSSWGAAETNEGVSILVLYQNFVLYKLAWTFHAYIW